MKEKIRVRFEVLMIRIYDISKNELQNNSYSREDPNYGKWTVFKNLGLGSAHVLTNDGFEHIHVFRTQLEKDASRFYFDNQTIAAETLYKFGTSKFIDAIKQGVTI